ncbi:ABC transporter permease [Haloparvum sp. PAK95]|uniref:ABC transporter permease n=1 Tax=Haloparvum sp. PAK95 TaxID=3418962 RepID=UPI003D2EC92B
MATEQPQTRIESYKEKYGPKVDRYKRVWSRFAQHRLGVIGLFILLMYILWAIFPSWFAPHAPEWVAYLGTEPGRMTIDQRESLPHPPAFGDPFFAPLGTNDQGYGVMTQLVYSAKNAMYIAIAAGMLSSLVGVPLGLISGYYGDTWIDESIQRLADITYGLPFLPLLIVLVAIRGVSTTNIILGIVVKSWVNNCIIIRGETLTLKERSYVESAKVAGASDTRVIFRHILPNVLPLTFVYLAQDAAGAILAEASLAYLGLSDFTAYSWGIMLQEIQGRGYVFDAWWWLLPPGLAITAIAAAFYFIGFSMEDVANPQR